MNDEARMTNDETKRPVASDSALVIRHSSFVISCVAQQFAQRSLGSVDHVEHHRLQQHLKTEDHRQHRQRDGAGALLVAEEPVVAPAPDAKTSSAKKQNAA